MSHSVKDPFEHDVRVFRSVFPGGKPASANGKTILILDRGSAGYIRYEIYLYRVLQTRGFNLVSVGWRKPDVVRYYDLLEIPFYYWDEFMPHVEAKDVELLIGHPRTFDE